MKNSWARFNKKYVDKGKKIARYHLVTAWTPTDKAREWFIGDVTSAALFERQWEGTAFLNGLAGDFPGTFAHFFDGPNPLERLVTQKAMLASVPPSEAESMSFVDSVTDRHAVLQDLLDVTSPHYFVNPSIRMANADGGIPFPTGEPGVVHRFEAIDDRRYRVISIVPKHSQATEIDPITIHINFQPVPGTSEETELFEWRTWGVPFQSVTAETFQSGGPLSDETPMTGTLQMIPEARSDQSWPPMNLERDGVRDDHIDFDVTTVTRGIVGEGIRVVAESASKILQIELRLSSSGAGSTQSIDLTGIAGKLPTEVEPQLRLLVGGEMPTRYVFRAEGQVLSVVSLDDVEWMRALHSLAQDLATLQAFVLEKEIVFPTLREIHPDQRTYIAHLAAVVRGEPQEVPWSNLTLTAERDKPEEFQRFTGRGHLVIAGLPTAFTLGQDEYRLITPIQHVYSHPSAPAGFDFAVVRKGDELTLVEGPHSKLTLSLPSEAFSEPYVWIQ
ncbi:hypothetical protein [Pseudarthrobacter sulfonivorans]|uniref:hypothetical protein n=1 Tax=Pseudarthrobacter sulfonivorans TaxID=121292 RepID=UPI0012FDED7E|nr:hypothetical protein [Pseudarthrobacter sulfonivorans]